MGPVLGRTRGKDTRILLLGLDKAGKTTFLYKANGKEVTTYDPPTIGFKVETVTLAEGVTLTVWDVGGQKRIRHLWKHYLVGTRGLHSLLQEPAMRGVPLVVVANKQDLPGAVSASEVARRMSLLENAPVGSYHVQGASARTGDGVMEGLNTMVTSYIYI